MSKSNSSKWRYEGTISNVLALLKRDKARDWICQIYRHIFAEKRYITVFIFRRCSLPIAFSRQIIDSPDSKYEYLRYTRLSKNVHRVKMAYSAYTIL